MRDKTMKALVLEEAYRLTMKEVPVPEVPEGYALVKILAVSVCGSDIHAYRGNALLLTYPRILGHELCGVVEEINAPAEDDSGWAIKSAFCRICPAAVVRPAARGGRTVVRA